MIINALKLSGWTLEIITHGLICQLRFYIWTSILRCHLEIFVRASIFLVPNHEKSRNEVHLKNNL